jgi:hypothetical protein
LACSASSLSFLECSSISKASSSAMLQLLLLLLSAADQLDRCSALASLLHATAFNNTKTRVAYSGYMHCGAERSWLLCSSCHGRVSIRQISLLIDLGRCAIGGRCNINRAMSP